MERFNKYQFIDALKEDIQEAIKDGDITDDDNLNEYIYSEVDRFCIYYYTCYQIVEELQAYEFDGAKNITELAMNSLTEYIFSEIDITELEQEISKQLLDNINPLN